MTNATFEGDDGAKRSATSQASSSQETFLGLAPAFPGAASVESKASGAVRHPRSVASCLESSISPDVLAVGVAALRDWIGEDDRFIGYDHFAVRDVFVRMCERVHQSQTKNSVDHSQGAQ